MKTLVVGATGVLGRRVVPLLVAAGHDVTAAARSDARARLLEELGASPVRVDVFDPAAVRKVVAGHEVVVNLATHIPPTAKMAMPGAWAENDRIRTEVSRHLVDAVLAENTVLSENTALSENTVLSENTALSGNSVRYVQESIAFVYRDGRDQWLDESSPVDPVANLASATVAEANAARVTAAGATGVILRFATFYGSDSGSSLAMIRLARRRIALGAGPDRYVSSITTDDAAAAVVASLSAPAGLYNVGDDEPMTSRDFFAALAGALGVRPPFIAPVGLAKLGGPKASVLVRSQRVSSGAFVEATGWKPEYRSVREGWPAVLAAITAQGAS